MQNDSFKMRQHYAPYNSSEESHRRTDGYIFLALVVGYFACAQYDVLFYLSLRGKRSDEANSREGGGLRSISFVLFRWDCRSRYAPSQ